MYTVNHYCCYYTIENKILTCCNKLSTLRNGCCNEHKFTPDEVINNQNMIHKLSYKALQKYFIEIYEADDFPQKDAIAIKMYKMLLDKPILIVYETRVKNRIEVLGNYILPQLTNILNRGTIPIVDIDILRKQFTELLGMNKQIIECVEENVIPLIDLNNYPIEFIQNKCS